MNFEYLFIYLKINNEKKLLNFTYYFLIILILI